MSEEKSVQPEWCRKLSVQQQSVLFLAGRGPDGIAKAHPCKAVQVAYRACVFVAAKYGRSLEWGERADTFMSMDRFADTELWSHTVNEFFLHADDLPHHYLMHLMHGVQILGYKHPNERIRDRWRAFYLALVDDLHLKPESEAEIDARLGDWGRKHWDHPPPDAFALRDGKRPVRDPAIAAALDEAYAATNLTDFAAAIAKIPTTEENQQHLEQVLQRLKGGSALRNGNE